MQLKGKTALITGGGSGIGQALAIEAARRGMAVALVGRRAQRLHETRSRLGSDAECLIIPGDVTTAEGRLAIRDRVAAQWGQLHFLVNNAGIVVAGPLSDLSDADLNRLMATNVIAPLALTRDLLPLLRTAAPSRVVNIGSMLGDIAMPLFGAYSASKFGLRGLSSAMRRELAGFDIGVTYAAPRGARTDATQRISRFVEMMDVRLDSVETIAQSVWNAAAGGRNVAYPRGRERLFGLIERLCPAIIDRALKSQLAAQGVDRLIEESTPDFPAETLRPAPPPTPHIGPA